MATKQQRASEVADPKPSFEWGIVDTTIKEVRGKLDALEDPDMREAVFYRLGESYPAEAASALKSAPAKKSPPAPKPTKVRLTADLPADVAETLNETTRLLGYNKLTTLVRALRVFGALVKVEKAGGSVVITEADGTRSKLIVQ